jgi:formylglycine-generating enzyme required for sulfatase activity
MLAILYAGMCAFQTPDNHRQQEGPIVNAIGMQFVRVEAGTFVMGSDEAGWAEVPHEVNITSPFLMSRYEVTQGQWEAVMGFNPSEFKGDARPVERVTWQDIVEFLSRLKEIEPDVSYRLPTEAEWEYAARAGTNFMFTGTDSLDELCRFGNIADLAVRVDTTRVYVDCEDGYVHTAPVGSFEPNARGIYDMTGNVWEWVSDRYDAAYYARSPANNPQGPVSGSKRVLRGGGWGLRPLLYRLSFRFGVEPDYRSHAVGFRLVRELED